MQFPPTAVPESNLPEAVPMPQDEALKLLQRLLRVPETSGQIRKTIGSVFVAEYIQIVSAPEVVEIDWMTMTGQMTEAQMGQYSSLSGEYERTMAKLALLAHKIAGYFMPRLPDLVRADFRGHGKEGLANLFQCMEKLCASAPPELADRICYRLFLGKMFKRMVFGLLGAQLIQIVLTTSDRQLGEATKKFLDLAEEISLRTEDMQFAGIQLHNELIFDRNALNHPVNQSLLDNLIGRTCAALSGEEKAEIIAENEATLAEVRKEASYKKILLHTLNDRAPQVVILGDDTVGEKEAHRYSQFCAFRINFNPLLNIGMPVVEKDRFGNVTYDYRNLEGVINFTLNPATGHLHLITNQTVNLSAILDPDRYLLLQHYSLKRLLEYLQSKEPDIDDLFLPSATETFRSEQADVHEQVEHSAVLDLTDACDTQTQEPTWKYEPYNPPAHDEPSAEQPGQIGTVGGRACPARDEFKALPKHLKKMIIDRIWGASGPEVMAVLRRLFGEPVRQTGSHVFFRSERTGETLPVPNGSYISPPLTMANAQVWGYSLLEFARELGLKI